MIMMVVWAHMTDVKDNRQIGEGDADVEESLRKVQQVTPGNGRGGLFMMDSWCSAHHGLCFLHHLASVTP